MSEVRILEQVETEEDQNHTPPSKWLTCLIEIVILWLALTLMFVVRQAWLEPAAVTSSSMESTLRPGERFLIDHRQSLSGKWQRGDIVLVETQNGGWGEDVVVKRIVGLPGEKVEIFRGRVFINGKALRENYLKETPVSNDSIPVQLGNGQYYLLGDNRNNSGDSREFGPVSNDEIRGRAVRRLWSFQPFVRPDYER